MAAAVYHSTRCKVCRTPIRGIGSVPFRLRGIGPYPKNPQLCVAPSATGDWEITPGKPYVSRYRFVIADGPADKAELDRLWNDYAKPPAVTVE